LTGIEQLRNEVGAHRWEDVSNSVPSRTSVPRSAGGHTLQPATNEKGCVARDRTPLHLENGINRREGFREPSTQFEFDDFDDMAVGGAGMKAKAQTNRLRRKSMEVEKAKIAKRIRGQDLTQRRKPNRQRLTNTNGNGKRVIWFATRVAAY
jgi:hypothetical protein